MCIKDDEENQIEYPVYFMINNRKLRRMDEPSRDLRRLILEEKKTIVNSRTPDKIEIKTLTPHPHLKQKQRLILAYTYGKFLKHRVFMFYFNRMNSETMDFVDHYELKDFEVVEYMEDSPLVTKYSHMHYFGEEWVSMTIQPKFQFVSLNSFMQIEYEYLDTNEILKQKFLYTFRLVTLVYRSLEDDKIYFAVYEITPFIERQLVRDMIFEEYNPFVEIDYLVITPLQIYIFMYDSSTGQEVLGFIYFLSGPFIISKSLHNIVIDQNRYSMELYEDKEMHWSFYKSLDDPVLYVDEKEKEKKISFKIKEYFDIYGNLLNINPSEANASMNSIPASDFEIIEPLHYRHTKKVLKNVLMSDYLEKTHYVENRVYFAINAKDNHLYTIFR